MITAYDYAIIAFYFVFTLGLGLVFRGLSKNTSDYFRCGGAIPWWITGASAWIAGFSAWTFVGAAAKVYETGTLVLWVFYPTAFFLILVYYYTACRFRRMRVVTWMEAVRARFGTRSEQFYTWVKLPLGLLAAGVSLNAIGVFMSSIFGVSMPLTLGVLGVVVTVVAVVGGAWAVIASDFVQMFLVMTITIIVAVLTLMEPAVGGVSGLVARVPSGHFDWSELASPSIIVLWILAQVWFKFSDTNNMENSTIYLMAKSDRDARRMVLIPLIGSFVGPLIWFVPSMAATILHPNLAAEYPNLQYPNEAAFVAVARQVLPVGMLGLLLCAMLGATITSMDSGLNKNVGVFVRSFYLPVLDPRASERRLLFVGKLCTIVFGAIVIGTALLVNSLRSIGLFDLTNILAGGLLMPMALPLIFGLFYRHTPGWSAWSTALVGFAWFVLVKLALTPEMLASMLGIDRPLTAREWTDGVLGVTTIGSMLCCGSWFFATSFFRPRRGESAERIVEPVSLVTGLDPAATAPTPADVMSVPVRDTEYDRIDRFFANMRTPIDHDAERIEDHDEVLYRLMGRLCIVFGLFVLLCLFIPGAASKWFAFVFCGGSMLVMGVILCTIARRRAAAAHAATTAADATMPGLVEDGRVPA